MENWRYVKKNRHVVKVVKKKPGIGRPSLLYKKIDNIKISS